MLPKGNMTKVIIFNRLTKDLSFFLKILNLRWEGGVEMTIEKAKKMGTKSHNF